MSCGGAGTSAWEGAGAGCRCVAVALSKVCSLPVPRGLPPRPARLGDCQVPAGLGPMEHVLHVDGVYLDFSKVFRQSLPLHPPREAQAVWAGGVVGEVDWELAEGQSSEGRHQRR